MTPPGLLARIAGKPIIGWPIVLFMALILFGSVTGKTDWWWGLLACLFMVRTFLSMAALRRYNAWLAEWNAMGTAEKPSAEIVRVRRFRWTLLIPLWLLLIPWFSAAHVVQESPALLNVFWLTWVVLIFYGGFRLVRRLGRGTAERKRKRKETSAGELAEDPIQLAFSGTKDSPTRTQAERNLPDYCLPLLARK